ncbi:MAG: IS21 family transposase [Desulfobacteraceae bacterium]|nr:IS21 family transposase [Desulfobacteraceae bacterium]
MPKKRLSMRKIKDVLRLKFESGLSNRNIGRSLKITHRTVGEYLQRFSAAGLSWPLSEEMDETFLKERLFPEQPAPCEANSQQMPDMKYLHKELRRKGVTLYMLWEEYRAQDPQGYSSTQFYHHYRQWAGKLHPVMRQEHKAGEKVYVDYAGKKPEIVNPHTGEITEVEIFIGALGASSYTYAEVTRTQSLPDWCYSHIRMLEFFGAAPEIVVPDNLKSGVTKACRYEPDLNPTYQDLCDYYGLAVVPARKKAPKDKAKVESAVRIAEKKILGELRDQIFFSLAELSLAVAKKVEEINTEEFQKLDVSRKELFEQLDRPVMRPLPVVRYEYGEWKNLKVNIDYHVDADFNYYSVHYSLIQKQVDVRLTWSTVEIWFKGRRVASHARYLSVKGKYSTLEEHRPKSHREYMAWTPERILAWGKKTGPWTSTLMEKVMAARKHPEQGYRSCLGILRLAQKFTPERLEKACHRAVIIRGHSYKSVKSILERGLDSQPLPEQKAPQQESLPLLHYNIRGKNYYT